MEYYDSHDSSFNSLLNALIFEELKEAHDFEVLNKLSRRLKEEIPPNSKDGQSFEDVLSHHESYLKNFNVIRHEITYRNYEQNLSEFLRLFERGVEYVAIDAEMTGIYTRMDEDLHLRKWDIEENDNVNKIVRGVRENRMFQLGLTIKTRDGHLSIWSFYLCPDLVPESFSNGSFNHMFIKHSRVQGSYEDKVADALIRIQGYANKAIKPVELEPFLKILFARKPTLIFFSGVLDYLNLFKAAKKSLAKTHKNLLKNSPLNDYDLSMSSPFNFYDTKYIEEHLNNSGVSLERLFLKLFDMVEMEQNYLHDASFDSLLTALVFEKMKAQLGEDRLRKFAKRLFKYFH